MYAPVYPCKKDCELRGTYCLSCEAWKSYEKARNEYYAHKYSEQSVNRSFIDKKTKRLKKAKRFIDGTLK